jgi:hypothetical protein
LIGLAAPTDRENVGRSPEQPILGGTPKRSLSVCSGATERIPARTVEQVWPCHPACHRFATKTLETTGRLVYTSTDNGVYGTPCHVEADSAALCEVKQ